MNTKTPLKIPLAEIKDTDQELHFDQTDDWLKNLVLSMDEQDSMRAKLSPLKSISSTKDSNRSMNVDLNFRKVDEVYVVSGDIRASVNLICSRCAQNFEEPMQNHFSTLYSKDREMAGISYMEDSQPRGTNQGHARSSDVKRYNGVEATDNLEIIYLKDEYLDLQETVKEQLEFMIPFRPLCKEDCKGMCSNCGANWNTGRCACQKLATKNPFASLSKINLKTVSSNKKTES